MDQDPDRVCRGSGDRDLKLQSVVFGRFENVCVADKQFYLLDCTIE